MAKRYDQEAVIQMVRKCLQEAVEKRKEEVEIPSPFPGEVGSYINDPWPIYDEFYRGDAWSRMSVKAAWKSLPYDMFAFVVVESNTTKLTDGHPKVEFAPRDPEKAELSRKLNAHFNHWWERGNGAAIDALAVKDSRKFCVGWLHLSYDRLRKKQVLEVIHPESCWVDRDTTAESFFSDEPNYLIYEYVVSVADILEAYPDVKQEDLRPNWLADATPFERIRSFFTANKTVGNPAQTIPVYELWIRDASTNTWEEQFGDGIVVKRGLKYPGGRLIKVAGGVVLEDKANPYAHKQFPFAPIHCYPESGRFYGGSDIKTILPMLVVNNKYDQILIDSAYKSGGGIGLVNPRYGLFAKQITNDPMQVHEVTDVEKALRWEQFPAAARHIVNHKEVLRVALQDAAGLHDQSMGRYTPGNRTAQETGIINESDNTRIRLAARFHSLALTRIGFQWLSNEGQFGTETPVRVMDEQTGEPQTETLTKADFKDAQGMEVIVGDFAMLPDRYQEIKQQAFNLFSMQAIDRDELLRAIEWPNYKTVAARMDKKEQEAVAAQAAAAQPPQEMSMEGMPPPEELAGMMGGEPGMTNDEAGLMQMIQQISQQNGMPPEQILAMLQGG